MESAVQIRIAKRRRLPLLPGILAIAVLLAGLCAVSPADARPRGLARIAVDAHTGEVLYASRSQVRWHPASLTKMMTLYQLFSALQRGKVSLNTKIKMSRRAARQPPSKLGIGRGHTIRVSDAIDALAVKSANDVAVAVAEKLAGTEVKFARQMNKTARYLGMSRTNFRNASGLHHSKQVTTARDMAILSVALMRDFPQYYARFSKKSFRFSNRKYRSHNRILKKYRGADGIKTGYIARSGFNLAASAVRNGKRIVAVVLGAKSSNHRTSLMTRLLNTGFAESKKKSRSRIARPIPIRLAAPPPIPRPRGYKQRRHIAPAIQRTPAAAPVLRPPPLPRPDPHSTPAIAAVSDAKPQLAAGRSTVKAATPSLHHRKADGGYSIQVGAYRSKNQAQARLIQIMNHLPLSHTEAEPAIVSIRGKARRVLYRARLTGYDQRAEASAACNWLKARKTDCVVVLNKG